MVAVRSTCANILTWQRAQTQKQAPRAILTLGKAQDTALNLADALSFAASAYLSSSGFSSHPTENGWSQDSLSWSKPQN